MVVVADGIDVDSSVVSVSNVISAGTEVLTRDKSIVDNVHTSQDVIGRRIVIVAALKTTAMRIVFSALSSIFFNAGVCTIGRWYV